jgi:hypothetical protein
MVPVYFLPKAGLGFSGQRHPLIGLMKIADANLCRIHVAGYYLSMNGRRWSMNGLYFKIMIIFRKKLTDPVVLES